MIDVLLIDSEHAVFEPRLTGSLALVVEGSVTIYHDATGAEIKGLIAADVDPRVDFNDFLHFSQAFGATASDVSYLQGADLDGDGRIGFVDFLLFSANFGRIAVDAPSSAAAKPATPAQGTGRMSLRVGDDGDGRLTLRATLEGAEDVRGWGFTLSFDPSQFEFVGARAPRVSLLESNGAYAPLFLVHDEAPGRVVLGSAITEGRSTAGDGPIAEMVFRPIATGANATFGIEGRCDVRRRLIARACPDRISSGLRR